MSPQLPDSTALLEELPSLPPDEQAARVRGFGPAEDVLLALGDAAEQLALTDAGRALAATECLVPLTDTMGSAVGQARARRARAHALCNAGRLEEGWLLCDEAARLAELGEAPVEAGKARMRSMQALGELGRFEDSIRAGEAALAAFERAGDRQLAARAEVNLGIVHQRRDEPARAVEYFEHARPQLGDAPDAIGFVDNNRGEALLALNDFSGARAAFEGNLGDLAARLGMLHKALYHFERARRRFESTGSTGHLSRLLTEQAETISVLGLPADALKQYEAALPQLDQAGQALEAARARAGLGRTLVQLKRFSDAETALAAAARAFDELGHNTARARLDLIRAELAAARGHVADSKRLIHAALSVLHDRPVDAATGRHLLARIALEEGQVDAAEAELIAAAGIARQLDLAPLLADILHTSARVRRRRGDNVGAVEILQEATAQVERVRSAMQGRRFRGAYLGDRLAVYEDLVSAELEEERPESIERAFTVAEQAKSRVLLDMVGGDLDFDPETVHGQDAGDEQELVAEFSTLRAELNGLYSRLADEDLSGTGGADPSWHQSVIDRERRLEMLEDRLWSTRGAAGLYARPADFEAASRAVAGGTTLIEYTIARGEVLAFVVREGRLVVFRQLAGAEQLDERMARFQFQIDRALRSRDAGAWKHERLLDDARAELEVLHDMLIRPLREAFDQSDRLLIVPHGPLHLLPFHALWNGRRYLIEEHEMLYCPSASLYAQLGEPSRMPREARALVVGVGDAAAPHIDAEVMGVASLLGAAEADTLLGPRATADRVGRAIGGAGIIHLACHARFAPATPLGSGVRLADRWLNVRDIYALQLRAEHVTLSGCETGRSLVRAGDELMGMLRGFFAAGARSLLVSLWRVDDESAAEIMSTFYGLWHTDSQARTKAAALREAQLEGLARRPHPAFWAPFRLVGRS
jgi:CHAT domain-containing protein/tetratricopeptide (TPR) repeat protein